MVCIVLPVFKYNDESVETCVDFIRWFKRRLTLVARLRHGIYQYFCSFKVAKLKNVKPDYLNISSTV